MKILSNVYSPDGLLEQENFLKRAATKFRTYLTEAGLTEGNEQLFESFEEQYPDIVISSATDWAMDYVKFYPPDSLGMFTDAVHKENPDNRWYVKPIKF